MGDFTRSDCAATGEVGQFTAGFVCCRLSHNGCTAVSSVGIILCGLKVTPDRSNFAPYLIFVPRPGQASKLAQNECQ
jgi:hypothetical protein